MRPLLATVVVLFASGVSAQSIPNYEVERWCKQVAAAGGTYSEMMYGGCMDMEQSAYDEIKPRWAGLSVRVQHWCNQVAKAGGTGSYSMLQGCIEMETSAASENATRQFRR